MRFGRQKVDQSAQPYICNRVTALLTDQWAVGPHENRDQGGRKSGLVNQRAVLVTPLYKQDFPARPGASYPAHVNLPGFSELQLDVLSITKLALDALAFDKVRCVVVDARVGDLMSATIPRTS